MIVEPKADKQLTDLFSLCTFEDVWVNGRSRMLQFPASWVGTVLPRNWTAQDGEPQYLVIELLDREDGKVYLDTSWCHYEDYELDGGMMTLKEYMFESHYCSYHRKQGARECGADTDDDCGTDRYDIKSISYKGILLLSETMTLEEAEAWRSSGVPYVPNGTPKIEGYEDDE